MAFFTNISHQKTVNQKPDNASQNAINDEQEIEVSIIIPSYNKYPLNVFTLYSFEKQNFDHSKFEVVFIDDASTDQTFESLSSYQPSYHFQYIRCHENVGRSKVRNIGIQSSRGKLLIFLDAEMIVKPDFVSNHYKQHQSQDNLILSGTMYYKLVYTSIFPSFTAGQIKNVESLVQKNPLLDQRYKKYDPNSTDIFTLNEKEEIGSELVEDLTIGTSNWFQIIIDNFGPELEGFNFPWMSFLTGNVSLKKELIIKARLFDEDFVHYGYEDWELGYRLNKLGGKYLQSEEIIAYHQEHPIGPDKWKEAIENFQLFKQKHPDVDVLILGLELAQITDLLTMNNVLGEYKHLVEAFPNEFLLFKQNFIEILETIITLLNIDIRHINILGAAGFGTDQKYNLLRETVQIHHLGMYQNLTNTVLKIMYS